ncbi:Histidine kinase [Streptoalloteichus tenebrarius]|uniref:Histidine kinase n=1 Tax=Streptoalloteichus tenebrarius (strain ATCC 17920 / DSM 40477 / JCM 4838 / CBS 697.72 / NBRC 16177 / NCIMB 11028 / NRRL B-12390 / A12253. 1 / ISP 5477) TaxID=1933 RepID=A0ABT1HQC9_STRSD|nr:histidine kinase dimerization/phosphoacceptor domain-containing protein [Streptoalloteichus tenebrarius]MCP2257718.1 Histidine kinase [Streptoalloteichus tenebrarius]BFE99928.1 hypothetical protein GCM10020241_16040 [Streptoalloteichus tenebrarius]
MQRVKGVRPNVVSGIVLTIATATLTTNVLVMMVQPLPLPGAAPTGAPPSGPAALGAAALIALHTDVLGAAIRGRVRPRHHAELAGVVVLAFLLPLSGPTCATVPVVAIGACAVVLPRRWAVVVVTLAAVAEYATVWSFGASHGNALFYAAMVPLYASWTFGTVWVTWVVRDLHDTRAQLARAAVDEERLRFARDLHDVLGHGLQVVALRAELASRLLPSAPERAGDALREIRATTTTAIREVREVVRGYRRASLDSELAGVTAVLRAAGVHVEAPSERGGLAGLAERLSRVDGAVSAGPTGTGEFRLVATAPRDPLGEPGTGGPVKEAS